MSKDCLCHFMSTCLRPDWGLFLRYLMATRPTRRADASHRHGVWQRYCEPILNMYMGLKMIDKLAGDTCSCHSRRLEKIRILEMRYGHQTTSMKGERVCNWV